MQVEDALVDAHLESVPCVGSLTARRLAGDDLELLRGQANGAGYLQLLLHCTLLQVGADLIFVKKVRSEKGTKTEPLVKDRVRELDST